MEDYEVILEVLAGNRNAYAKLVERHESKVRGYCLMMLSDPSEAEDAAQEVFMKAYQSLQSFRGSAAFSTWLYRIAVNHCKDRLRQKQRRKQESWDALLEKEGEKAEALLSTSTPVSFPEETAELLSKMLSSLPEKFREIIVLREMQGLSYSELSAALDCTLDAVKSRLKRARQELELKLRHFMAPKASKP